MTMVDKAKIEANADWHPGRTGGKRRPGRKGCVAADHSAPDLSHIAEGLRSLAVPVSELAFMVGNPRTHDDANLAAIQGSLAQFGQLEPLVVNRRPNPPVVIGGNGRLQAALALGWTHLAVCFVDVDEATANAIAIALNRTAELAAWDTEALQKLMQEVATGADPRLDAMLADLARQVLPEQQAEGLTDPDAVPEPPDAPITKPGDLWLLGRHRLLCGDSSLPEDVDRLLDGAVIHLANTDPPYNVKVEPRSNNAIAAGLSSFEGTKHHQQMDVVRYPQKAKPTGKKLRAKDRPLANDFVSDQEFDRLLHAWFGNVARVLLPGHGFFVWGGYANLGNYPPVLAAHGLYFSQGIVWDKQHPVLTRKDFMGCFELAFYGWKEGAAHRFFGPTNAQDLWHVKKVNPQSMVHLTEKPVELAVRALQYSSRPGENVLDLFGGSGSTLIAAEQTGRRAFLMELDPLYCDVIVARYEQFTGQKAVLAARRRSASGKDTGATQPPAEAA
jgi:DNA modification methylase